jgi:hypothetical protein
MVRRFLLMSLLLATACDQKPPTAEQQAIQEQKKYDDAQAAKLRSLEGKSFYAAHVVDDAQIFFAHSRKDCPVHQADLKKTSPVPPHEPTYQAVILTIRNGRFVDQKGFFYTPAFCDTCVP